MVGQNLSIVTTCKGRLAHLQQTLPTYVRARARQVIVVDYDCPEGTAGWVKRNFPTVDVTRVADKSSFNLPEARNRGAALAVGEYILFIDADILLNSNHVEELNSLRGPFFLRNAPVSAVDRSAKQTFGTCIVRRADFIAMQGYDEAFTLYGGEDSDLYRRLVHRGIRQEYFSSTRFASIPHDDAARMQFKTLSDLKRSKRINKIYSTVKYALEDKPYLAPLAVRRSLFEALSGVADTQNFSVSVKTEDGKTLTAYSRKKFFLFGKTTYRAKVT